MALVSRLDLALGLLLLAHFEQLVEVVLDVGVLAGLSDAEQ